MVQLANLFKLLVVMGRAASFHPIIFGVFNSMHSQTLFLSKIKADHIPCLCVHVTSNAIFAGKNFL